MALQIGRALGNGARKVSTRTGVVLTVAYFAVYVVYQYAYNGVIASLAADTGTTVESVGPALDAPLAVSGGVVLAALVLVSYLTVVMARTFVAGATDRFPEGAFTDGIAFAIVNLFVGGIAYGLLVGIGTLLIVVPGIIAYVGLLFMTFFVAVENENFVAAMQDSWNLTYGHKWTVFGLLVVMIVIGVVVGMIVATVVVAGAIASDAAGIGQFLMIPIIAVLNVYFLAVLASAYRQLGGGPGDYGGGSASSSAAPTTA